MMQCSIIVAVGILTVHNWREIDTYQELPHSSPLNGTLAFPAEA